MRAEHEKLYPCLTDEQKGVYHNRMDVVEGQNGGVFFLYGYGGTGHSYGELYARLFVERVKSYCMLPPVALPPFFILEDVQLILDLAYP